MARLARVRLRRDQALPLSGRWRSCAASQQLSGGARLLGMERLDTFQIVALVLALVGLAAIAYFAWQLFGG